MKTPANRRGMVLIERGGIQSWVLPASVETWEKEGWSKVSEESKNTEVRLVPVVPETQEDPLQQDTETKVETPRPKNETK